MHLILSRIVGPTLATYVLLLGAAVSFGQADFVERFDGLTNPRLGDHDPPTLIAAGLQFRNQSDPLGSGHWRRSPSAHQGHWFRHADFSVGWWVDEEWELTRASRADSRIPLHIVEFESMAPNARLGGEDGQDALLASNEWSSRTYRCSQRCFRTMAHSLQQWESSPDLFSQVWETFGTRTSLNAKSAFSIGLDMRLAPPHRMGRRRLRLLRISTSKSATESLAQTIRRFRSATVDRAIETTPIQKSAAKGNPLLLLPCPGRSPCGGSLGWARIELLDRSVREELGNWA